MSNETVIIPKLVFWSLENSSIDSLVKSETFERNSWFFHVRKVQNNFNTVIFGTIPNDSFRSHHKGLGSRLVWFLSHRFVDGNKIHLVDFKQLNMLLVQNRITGSLYNHLTLTPFWKGKRPEKAISPMQKPDLDYLCPKKFKKIFKTWVGAAFSIDLPPISILILLFKRACIPGWFDPITITEFNVSNIKA